MLIMVVKDRVSKEAFNSFCLINIKDNLPFYWNLSRKKNNSLPTYSLLKLWVKKE